MCSQIIYFDNTYLAQILEIRAKMLHREIISEGLLGKYCSAPHYYVYCSRLKCPITALDSYDYHVFRRFILHCSTKYALNSEKLSLGQIVGCNPEVLKILNYKKSW